MEQENKDGKVTVLDAVRKMKEYEE